ncbi:hypothetical protein [Xenorhabdus sp. TS4]|uniref:hypothetical protein n=1 Tax=Xenorhabdus sp. TS4 TaxID=1873483 RepID=UPI001656D5E9|nr:hypothetical protein [Xenorhabdus sp. TS4]MBC8948372.1 hypothetical protein [Xenorhabdus sp. TS4]
MNNKSKNNLLPPKLPQGNLSDVINISDIIAMQTKYIVMQVNKYEGVELLDKIEGGIYLKDNVNAKVKSVTYHVTSDEELEYDFYLLLFHVNEMKISGLCEAKYTVTDLNGNHIDSPTSSITIIGDNDMSNADNAIIFLDAKNSILSLREISINEGVRLRAKFKDLVVGDTIIIEAKFLSEDGTELITIHSDNIDLNSDAINDSYKDHTIKTNQVNFLEVKNIVAKFTVLNKKTNENPTQISIINDLDTVNIKVQTTKNIGIPLSDNLDIKPFLTAVIYTGSNNSPINARLTNAKFIDGTPDAVVDKIDEHGVAYLHIYSDDITKNSVLILNYEDPVIAHKVPLDFGNWMSSSGQELSYTYSSYGVADGTCQCLLLIKLFSENITGITVSFDSPDIKINGASNTSELSNPDSSKILVYELTSMKAVRSSFTINVSGISMDQIRNTIVFVDPLTL